ncbi:MAG: hypothetical protein CL897_04515 [Dehalococcoidia bacterium]|nr:hypothetical protein [Dehalococcoidia bacterium]HCV00925.1 hypothetical protein [Dehalococcoidia bacterium]
MINYDDVFHIGIIVPEIESGMAEISKRFGASWPRPPGAANVRVRTKAGVQVLSSRFAYTAEGPPYIELIEAVPGTVWEAGKGSRIHHLGAFVDDLDEEISRLTAEGAELEMATVDEDGKRVLGVSYINSDLGVRLELLPSSGRERILSVTKPE